MTYRLSLPLPARLLLVASLAAAAIGCDNGSQGATIQNQQAPSSEQKSSADVSIGTPKTQPDAPVSTGPVSAIGEPPKKGEEVAVLETTQGQIVFKFFPNKAPKTVANFKKLANDKFYDGTKFHRAVPGFMIQGGDPLSKSGNGTVGTGGPGYSVKAEFNDIKHVRGVVSMARSSDPDSAGSQFFIVQGDSSFLDNQYTAFGQVVSGMEAVDKIVALPTNSEQIIDTSQSVVTSIKIVKWPIK